MGQNSSEAWIVNGHQWTCSQAWGIATPTLVVLLKLATLCYRAISRQDCLIKSSRWPKSWALQLRLFLRIVPKVWKVFCRPRHQSCSYLVRRSPTLGHYWMCLILIFIGRLAGAMGPYQNLAATSFLKQPMSTIEIWFNTWTLQYIWSFTNCNKWFFYKDTSTR